MAVGSILCRLILSDLTNCIYSVNCSVQLEERMVMEFKKKYTLNEKM